MKPKPPIKDNVMIDPPKGTDPLIKCEKCKVWASRKAYCPNCGEVRKEKK